MQLKTFEASELHLVEPWFNDPETRRWLGGPRKPRQMLNLMNHPLGEFRGARETGRFRWLASVHEAAIGFIDCGTYDRPLGQHQLCGGSHTARTSSLHPDDIELMRQPELAEIRLFGAGVEPDNLAFIGSLVSAGLEALDARPDWEGMVYYVKRIAPG